MPTSRQLLNAQTTDANMMAELGRQNLQLGDYKQVI